MLALYVALAGLELTKIRVRLNVHLFHVGSRGKSQVIRGACRLHYLLSHLPGPHRDSYFFWNLFISVVLAISLRALPVLGKCSITEQHLQTIGSVLLTPVVSGDTESVSL